MQPRKDAGASGPNDWLPLSKVLGHLGFLQATKCGEAHPGDATMSRPAWNTQLLNPQKLCRVQLCGLLLSSPVVMRPIKQPQSHGRPHNTDRPRGSPALAANVLTSHRCFRDLGSSNAQYSTSQLEHVLSIILRKSNL